MANGVNKVILIGNLGSDPETRFLTSNGNAVCNLSIATNESWRDKQTGELRERVEWHRVVMFQRLAEIASEFLRAGSKVYIEGRLRTRKWRDAQEIDRYTTEIHVDEMQMLGDRQNSADQVASAPAEPAKSEATFESASESADTDQGAGKPTPKRGGGTRKAKSAKNKAASPEAVTAGDGDDSDGGDDDIPF